MNPKSWAEAAVELIWRIGLRFAIWAATFYVIYRVRSIIVFTVLAAVLTYAVIPVVDLLCARRIPGMSRKIQRLGATFLVFLVLGCLVALVVTESAKPFGTEFSSLRDNYASYGQKLKTIATSAQEWYKALPQDAQVFIKQQNVRWITEPATAWFARIGQDTLNVFNNLIKIILIPVLAFYFTLDSRSLKREFLAVLPRRRIREALAIMHEINGIMRSYVAGQIILCVIAGLSIAIILKIMNMPYVLILSIFAAITRAVPVIGPVVSGLAIVLLGTAQSPILGFDLLLIFIAIQFIESKFIMPKLIGDRMRLHPAIIIISLLVGAEFFDIFGMFMAAPVAALTRVLIRYYVIKPKKLHVWGLSHQVHEQAQTISPVPVEELAGSPED